MSIEYIWMLEPVGLSTEGITVRMMEDPVQHGSGKHGITHHLCPVHDLLVRGKYDGGCLVGITDEGEETVCLAAGDRGIADLILWEVHCYEKLLCKKHIPAIYFADILPITIPRL